LYRHQPPVSPARRSSGRALIVFGPLLAIGAVIALLAMATGLYGWHPDEMRLIADSLGGVVMRLAVALLYRQARQRRFSDQSLHNMEARVGGIVESAMDAIITVDDSENIVLFNKTAEEVFGCPRSEALGAPLSQFIPERFRGAHSAHIERFGRASDVSRRMGAQRIVTGLRRNGEEFPIDASISYINERGGKFYTVILRDVTERVRADEALRRSKEELRELASVASSIREQEKSRIARELHDELAQALTALKMDLNWVKDTLPLHERQIVSKLEAMQIMVDGTVKATRRIAADLRPLMLDDLGLIPAAEWLVKNFTQRTGIPCDFSADPPGLELQDPHATAIFRILQESLTNIAKHAQASTVDVTVDMGDGEITLRVRDNGCGFDPGHSRKPNSFGLVGVRERAYLLDGEVAVDSAPGKGTVIEVRIPLSRTTTAP
jgi:PAS domain S-box-containing protein